MYEINRVAVLGSGVMGGGIAAHLANCGIPSLMLDIVPPDITPADRKSKAQRDAFAARSKQNLLKQKPAPLYRKTYADRIEIGNFDDDMGRIVECDWVIEVVKEDLGIKKQLFKEVIKHRKPGTILSSNTSGISISAMADVLDADAKNHFLGTHFFNPPRYLKLVEIIPAPDTKPDVIEFMAHFLEDELGKGVVYAKDTPNFIANRILTFGAQYIMHEMRKDGLTVEEVDAVTGPAVGHASSATFRTADLVGLDTFINVIKNVAENAPNDERIDLIRDIPDFLTQLYEQGWLGDKTGSGFYKATKERDEKGKRVILGLDLDTLEYRAPVKPKFESTGKVRQAEKLEDKIRIMHTGNDKGAQFAWKVFANTAVYAGNRIPEIADDIVQIDNACRWGFAWEIGIFETWEVLGFEDTCKRMEKDGLQLPLVAKAMREKGAKAFYKYEGGRQLYFDLAAKNYKPVPINPNVLILDDLKKRKNVVKENGSCSLIDIGDGILCAEFHTKMNSIDQDMGQMLQHALDLLNEGQFEGMVVGNQGEHFCAGANIFLVLGEAMQQNWKGIEDAIDGLQRVQMGMRFCKRPVVSAPHHFTLGGGCEIAQHAARAVIAGETYCGLVEVGVGLIPAGGGCKEMLRRALAYVPKSVTDADPFPYVRRAFENIAQAKVSTSGAEAVELGYLSETDFVVPSSDQQIKRAKDVCLGLIKMGYKAPLPATLTALGEPARAAFRVALYGFQLGGFASEHDVLIAENVSHILTGGDRPAGAKLTEQDVLDLEREAFVSLCGTEKTQQRMQAMLTTGKPLRN
ncbi:MAG: 3-hydroxyacyl-CoA dehydrogenase/enoyl-CoA hydratase family protein [Candidatus Hydrogenedentales bacterium]